MQSKDESTEETIENNIREHKQFINEENFKLLKNCQHEVYEVTELSPSMRKIVNELINVENVNKVKNKLIEKWSN